ncbi:hypothetical protein GCM10027169_00020 [Gordonia jinhuaensis]
MRRRARREPHPGDLYIVAARGRRPDLRSIVVSDEGDAGETTQTACRIGGIGEHEIDLGTSRRAATALPDAAREARRVAL